MKKRMFVCCFVFTISVFHILTPNVVFGQSLADIVFERYEDTLTRPDIRPLLPVVLRTFEKTEIQDSLEPGDIGLILSNPFKLKNYDSKITPEFMGFLGADVGLRMFFADDQFYQVLDDPIKIRELLQLLEGEPIPMTLEIISDNNQDGVPGAKFPIIVRVLDQKDEPLTGHKINFQFTVSDGELSSAGDSKLSSAIELTDGDGQAETTLTLGSDLGIYQVEASVDGYSELIQTFTAAATEVECEVTDEQREAGTLTIASGNNQSGEFNTRLDYPFVVVVREQDNSPLVGIGVTFRVTLGGGQLSDTTAITDSFGRAETTLTLGSVEGGNRVRASVVGISQEPTFTAMAVPPAAPLPPSVYWIEGGVLYRRSTDDDEETPLNVLKKGWNLTGGLTVDMKEERIYWTEANNKSKGRIRSASLDGEDDKVLVKLLAEDGMPYGVAIGTDSRNKRWVYWTTSLGKVQRIEVGGSGDKRDLIDQLSSPKHIAFDEEMHKLYWTEELDGSSRIRRANANGRSRGLVIRGLGVLGGIAVADGIVYWTEQTGDRHGKVRSANGNGSGVKLLDVLGSFNVLESVPEGIAVDAEGGKLYWTTSLGDIQSVPLNQTVKSEVTGRNIPVTSIALGRASVESTNGTPGAPAAPSTIAMRPEGSALLANYPNPFNPETWIPYQLSEAADVTVSIYSVNGALVRNLTLGHQAAGMYRSKSRAAYWDGRNDFGERVASGLYFYTLTAGDFTATRKMLIRK